MMKLRDGERYMKVEFKDDDSGFVYGIDRVLSKEEADLPFEQASRRIFEPIWAKMQSQFKVTV